MANSLRSKIKKLYHDNNISEKMCNELLEKLEGHDRELRAKTIDEFAERLRMNTSEYEVMDGFGAIEEIVDAVDIDTIFEIAEQMKGE